MTLLTKSTTIVLSHPVDFALKTLRNFNKNQGMLMAGAIAYYSLLSLLPLLVLSAILMANWVEPQELLSTMAHYLAWLVPSQSQAVLADVTDFLDNQMKISFFLMLTMLFFSTQAFSIVEQAMTVIFYHHSHHRKRHFLISAVLPYCFFAFLCVALLLITIVSSAIQALGEVSIHVLSIDLPLIGLSGVLLYIVGMLIKIVIVTFMYLVLPIARIGVKHALVGGTTVALLWEIIHYILIWYFTTLSQASIVYGSLTTAVVALFSMEIAAALLLLGAQLISEYERI